MARISGAGCQGATSTTRCGTGQPPMRACSCRSASSRGTIEEPGTNVAAKSGLNKSIAEQTWGMIRQQLSYKAEWAGRIYAEVNPRNTSRTCSQCGLLGTAQEEYRMFRCPACKQEMDRDVNAAINILKRSEGTPLRALNPKGYQRLGPMVYNR